MRATIIMLLAACIAVWGHAQDLQPKAGVAGQYNGLRLHVYDAELVLNKKGRYDLQCSVANTGRQEVSTQKNLASLRPLVLTFEEHSESDATAHYDHILYALLTQDIALQPGAYTEGLKLSWSTDELPDFNTLFVHTSEKAQSSTETKQGEMTTSRVATESRADKPASTSEDKGCGDLSFGEIIISKKGKHKLEIAFDLRNSGNRAISLFDQSNKDEPGMAVKVYYSGTPNLSRGSKLVEGFYLKDILRTPSDAMTLEAGQEITVQTVIDQRERSRYSNVLILQADAFGTIDECVENNNIGHSIISN